MREYFRRMRRTMRSVALLERRVDELKMAQGAVMAALNAARRQGALRSYEFKVFSQWGEDGLIQRLISTVEIRHRTFIEFGVEDFLESNCRFLLMHNNWRGFVIDGSRRNMRALREAYFFWMYDLKTECAFITRDNINSLLAKSGFDTDLGILSVDLDGMDYWILEAIEAYVPRILIMEYNAVFGPTRMIAVPYEAQFRRAARHYSHLYYGASLAALTALATRKGYALVGTGSKGGNAFFVRRELLSDDIPEIAPDQAYIPPHFREARDPHGRLTHLSAERAYEAIRGLPVVNVVTGELETV